MNEDRENYTLHICLESELFELQKFINDHWKKNHVLSISKELMDWQYYKKDNKCYNFVIAKHNDTNEIYGILGFIPTSHFDKSIQELDLWLAIWKVRVGNKVSGLGLSLLHFLVNKKRPRSISAFGLSRAVIPIYKYFGYKMGILSHYYIINNKKENFYLIGNFDNHYYNRPINIEEKKFVGYDKNQFYQLTKKLGNFTSSETIPAKSLTYLYNRYVCHPVYDYHIYGLLNKNVIVGFLVLRLVSYSSYYALRVIDYFGDITGISGTFKEFQKLLHDYNAEYVDCYNMGFDEEMMTNSGFIKKKSSSKVIIPNYFEPFEKKNVELNYAFKCDKNLNFFVCKGDSDQDRPNFVL